MAADRFLFTYCLDEDGEVEAKWGPRAAAIQEYVMEFAKTCQQRIHLIIKKNRQEFIERITAEYTSKPELWLTVYDDIRKTFFRYCRNNPKDKRSEKHEGSNNWHNDL